jgi:hypothetical protein
VSSAYGTGSHFDRALVQRVIFARNRSRRRSQEPVDWRTIGCFINLSINYGELAIELRTYRRYFVFNLHVSFQHAPHCLV